MAGSEKPVYRHQFADYLNCGSPEAPDWQLMGHGFTELNETFGAETDSVKYVNDVVSSTSVESYTSQFPFTAHMIKSEEAINTLYAVGRNHLVGGDAEFEYCRVELWDPITDDEECNEYSARKFTVSVELSDITGESKQEMTGNLNAIGDPTDGTFDVENLAFKEAA